ncbi:MAG: flagellar filament capping protein FliD [Bacillota bacterium]|nr:flagellar filament capping protein FliD [Bacillota bacterium]
MALNGVGYPNQAGFALNPTSYVGQVGGSFVRPSPLQSVYAAQKANQLWYRLNRSLLQLRTEAANLARPELWTARTATSSDPETVGATARNDARVGTYAVGVTALAAAEKLGTAAFATTVTPLGVSGTFQLDGREVTVETGDTLTTLADKLNRSGARVQGKVEAAAEGGYRVTLTSTESGQAGALTLADTTPGVLAQLGLLDAEGQKAYVLQAPADAVYTVDGKEYTSSTNNPVFAGVALTLKQTTAAPVTVSVAVSHDEETIVASARKFVEAYNAALADLSRMTRSGSWSSRANASRVQRELVSALHGPAVRTAEAPPRLSELGFTLGPGGTLTLDEAAFRQELAANREGAAKAFTSPAGAAEQVRQTLAPLTSPVEGYNPSTALVPAASWVASQAFNIFAQGATPRELELNRQASVLQGSLALLARQQAGLADRLYGLFNP